MLPEGTNAPVQFKILGSKERAICQLLRLVTSATVTFTVKDCPKYGVERPGSIPRFVTRE